jgi:hypothetical protein
VSPVYKPGHRMSAAPVTQYCSHAGVLGSIGAGRAAAQSSAWHALCSGAPDAQDRMLRLSPEEAAELTRWHRVADVDLGNGLVLRYADALKEFSVAIDRYGSYVDPSSPEAISTGHPDFAWIVQVGSLKIAYVGDIKRSEWTVDEGTDSLQLHAYGLAVATKFDCDAYAVGIWAAIEGRWQWSELIDLESEVAHTWAKRVVAAVTNDNPDYAMGPHCRSCYGRVRCPAWLLPPQLASTELAPLTGATELTQDKACELLLTYQRFVDTAKRVEETLKDYAARNGGIRDPKTKKVWLPVICQGRESVSVQAVREAFGPDADRVIRKGPAYSQYKWVNDR